ncbi:MAG: AhpC/TSA family protein [Bacteroidales bacterium]|nr:AhpC/TSA family protein [Bacteroidales bacterium]
MFYIVSDLNKGMMALLLFVSIALLTGCNDNGFSVRGTIEGAGPGEYLLLREVKPGLLVPVDSMMPDDDGKFSFRSATEWPAFYMLSMESDDFLTLLITPGDKIEVKANRNALATPEAVTGSEGTSVILGFREKHQEVINELQRLTDVYDDSLMSPQLPLLMDSLDRRAADIVDDFREIALRLLDDNDSSMVSVYLLNQHVVPGLQLFDPAKEPGIFFRVDSVLYALWPESELVLDLHTFVAGLRNSVSVNTGIPSGTRPAVGSLLPDIALPGPDGDTLALSSMRGKVVLVDFWAAWCPPCREENPNLVKMYDMYHWLGFDIYQVSLDLRKEEWTEAIRKDRLGRWKHVSDLKYRDSEVVKRFGLTEIPASFLIDREGRVLAVNLRGDDLRKKLDELLGGQ